MDPDTGDVILMKSLPHPEHKGRLRGDEQVKHF
jgi:hypothetical protein